MIRRIISLVGILCISTLLFTDANAKGKPDKPDKPDKNGDEWIIFSGEDLVGAAVVEGCCPNAGPSPAYAMYLVEECGDLDAGTIHEGQLYISVWNAGGNPTAMVEFWVTGGNGFYFIGGVIERDRKNKHLTVTFTDEPWNWHDPNNELPKATATFVLDRFPAD